MTFRGQEYRPYGKGYKGRFYRLYRIIFNNWIFLSRNWWSRTIIIIGSFFAFIQIMFFVFGVAGFESSSEDFFANNNDVRLEMTPLEDELLLHHCPVGGYTTFSFKVRNLGNDWGRVDFYPVAPNTAWRLYLRVEGNESELAPDDTMIVHLDIYAPENITSYLHIEEQNLSLDDFDLGALASQVDLTDLGSLASMAMGYMGQISENMNTIDEYNTTRMIRLYAFFKPWDDIPTEAKLADIRTTSIDALVSLDKHEYSQRMNEIGVDVGNVDSFNSEFNITIGKRDDQRIASSKVKAGEYTDFDVVINNNGNVSIRVVLDIVISQSRDPMWRYEAQGLSYDLESLFENEDEFNLGALKGHLDVRPGRSRNFTLRVYAGNFSIRKPYNIIVTGTDIANPAYQASNSTMAIAKVNKVITSDASNRTFYNLIWGKDFNYERFLWLIFLSSVAGAGILANDRRFNSVSLYLSRPISKAEYIFGKATALYMFLTLVTIVPALVLFWAGMLTESVSLSFIMDHMWILGVMMLSYVITLGLFTAIAMAISSMTKKWMFAGAVIFAFWTLPPILVNILLQTFDVDWFRLISLRSNLKAVFKIMFDIKYNVNGYGYDWYYPAGVLTLVFLAACALIAFRMWRTEMSE